MEIKTQCVQLTVKNIPGVLGRVVGQIRNEGWNIKRLFVDETSDPGISQIETDIEGINSKLALVTERMLNIDCVISITVDGNQRVKKPILPHFDVKKMENTVVAPQKPENCYRILTINPGSTSTKYAIYDNEQMIFSQTIRHDKAKLSQFSSIEEQKDYRKICIVQALASIQLEISTFDAIAGRGGLLKPIESGTYLVNATMLEDLKADVAAVHASALGAIIGNEIGAAYNIPAYVVDPIVVDEMDRNAKLTGIPGIERVSIFHALNQKAIARKVAAKHGKPYENCRLVVAHLGGGITVGAHRYGRVIDVNDALSGEGAFTPERSGSIPAVPLVKMCFSGEYTMDEMLDKVIKNGGVQAYLGTNDVRQVEKMINSGDEFAALVLDSMAYQVSKEIGAMCAVLEGNVDAIILTGGLAYSNRFTGVIKQRVDKFAPVEVIPGENEMFAMMEGVLGVLRGERSVSVYE